MLNFNITDCKKKQCKVLPRYVGHRQRLKKRIITTPPEHIADYELLELILFSAITRKDVKPLAKQLLEQVGNLTNLINIDKEQLLSIKGANENIICKFCNHT